MMAAPRVRLPDGVDGWPVTREIQREFPGVCAWYGSATGSWWAMVTLPGRARLLEAVNPVELRKAIANAWGWPWPR
ncbi:hypothetical protein E1289_25565 [Actinomadura sp. 6K520]|nr:hypothetical protein E1289_25565 [Actinomadura sp. 6K520]